jgi:RNA polymerase sigma-70 factor, ECF subfamily
MPQTTILSLATIYQAHVHDVARWVQRLAGPGFDLPDLVHEVFEIVQRRLPSFRGDSALSTWLYGITEKVVRHRRRKDRLRHWLAGAPNQVAGDVPARGFDQHECLEQKERLARVYHVLDRLSAKDREILILFELEELPGDRIAALLGIRVENVWLRMHRARERFLKAFREYETQVGALDAMNERSDYGRNSHAG